MPKYPEGTRNQSGTYIVRGGRWVPLEAPGEAAAIAGAQRRSDPQPSDPEFYGDPKSIDALVQAGKFRGDVAAAPIAAGVIGAGMAGGLIGAPALGTIAKEAALYGASEGAEKLLGLPPWAAEAFGLARGGNALRKGGLKLGKMALGGLLGGAEEALPAVAKGAMSTTATAAAEAAPAVGKAVSRSVLPAAEAAVPGGAQKTVNTIMREFAKKAAPEAKTGERIWLKLGPDGLPLSVVTPGQAARLAQTAKTWVARTW